MSGIRITPVSPVLGAEIRGIDLAAGVSDEDFGHIKQAFLDHRVVFFREQSPLDASAQVAFATRFGPLHRHPAAPASGDDGAIFVIHAHRDSAVANGNGWHTDVSCERVPPMATMLQLQIVPENGGGDTLFANMEAAYDSLSAEMRAKCRGLQASHESEHVYRGRYADRGVDDADAVYPAATHPVVRTHPETGRPSLYVNRSFTRRIVGMDDDESRALLGELYRHCEQPEFQIRFRWQTNDIALWDNRCLMHFAIWDYWPNERKGTRVSILGDRPSFDPNAPEPPPSPIRMSYGALT